MYPRRVQGRPSKVLIRLDINGEQQQLAVEPRTTLLEALRYALRLTGSKQGCDKGDCGACTVLVGGRAQLSCIALAVEAQGRKVTTIEGLSADGSHPLQKAWVELGVPQCGFCQAGQIMTAAALLAKRPKPSDREIDESMGGNICRCATYIRIRSAIKKAAGVPGGDER